MSDNEKLIAEALEEYATDRDHMDAVLTPDYYVHRLVLALEAANGKIQQIKGALADYLMDDEADEVDALQGISNIVTDD